MIIKGGSDQSQKGEGTLGKERQFFKVAPGLFFGKNEIRRRKKRASSTIGSFTHFQSSTYFNPSTGFCVLPGHRLIERRRENEIYLL